MPSEVMDRRRLSFFSDEFRLPAERQLGFCPSESFCYSRGIDGRLLMPANKSIASSSSSSLERICPIGSNYGAHFEFSKESYNFKDWNYKLSLDRRAIGFERGVHMSINYKKVVGHDFSPSVEPISCIEGKLLNSGRYEDGVFSCSLPEVFDQKLNLSKKNSTFKDGAENLEEDGYFPSMKEIEAQIIGDLLPDDDDLLNGVADNFISSTRTDNRNDTENDLFSSSGGFELEPHDSPINKVDDFVLVGLSNFVAGEHPSGEHPSRTLFVRNINSNVEDAELRNIFEKYGDIQMLYTACKHRGFVIISYYDIRAARHAIKALQNKPLRRRKLDIHFSIPKDNPSDKDISQGTLVVRNLDPLVSNDDLLQIFGIYGEIKEIRETPNKSHRKFVEFYDVRAAEAALRALHESDIAAKRIKVEPSLVGGPIMCAPVNQFPPELEADESGDFELDQSTKCLQPGIQESGANSKNTVDCGSNQHILCLADIQAAPIPSYTENGFFGTPPVGPHTFSSPILVTSGTIRGNPSGHVDMLRPSEQLNVGFRPRSLPKCCYGLSNSITQNSTNAFSHIPVDIKSLSTGGNENGLSHRVVYSSSNSPFEQTGAGSCIQGNGSFTIRSQQFILNNSSFGSHTPGSVIWSNSSSFFNNSSLRPLSQMHGVPSAHSPNSVLPLLNNHHVGSAPTLNPSIWDGRRVYSGDSADVSSLHSGSFGSMGFSGSSLVQPSHLACHKFFPKTSGNRVDSSIPPTSIGIASSQASEHRSQRFHLRNTMIHMPALVDSHAQDQVRSRRGEANAIQGDNKSQFELDIVRIVRGEDSRTTLMIKNIPNKYTSKMLLVAIDENHRGTYDFIYLPIDFKNKCNVGYAFINMIDPQRIIPFYEAFNGKKWEKFNSEKVASLAYARIQGKQALIAHFQNSSLMNEDKRCRPILFHSEGPNAGDQEPFPVGQNVRSRHLDPGAPTAMTIIKGVHQPP